MRRPDYLDRPDHLMRTLAEALEEAAGSISRLQADMAI